MFRTTEGAVLSITSSKGEGIDMAKSYAVNKFVGRVPAAQKEVNFKHPLHSRKAHRLKWGLMLCKGYFRIPWTAELFNIGTTEHVTV